MEKHQKQPETYQEILDKYDLRVLRILWFFFGFIAAVISIMGYLIYNGYVKY